eukprot:765045-Hanusia_phi.AAC.3
MVTGTQTTWGVHNKHNRLATTNSPAPPWQVYPHLPRRPGDLGINVFVLSQVKSELTSASTTSRCLVPITPSAQSSGQTPALPPRASHPIPPNTSPAR